MENVSFYCDLHNGHLVNVFQGKFESQFFCMLITCKKNQTRNMHGMPFLHGTTGIVINSSMNYYFIFFKSVLNCQSTRSQYLKYWWTKRDEKGSVVFDLLNSFFIYNDVALKKTNHFF